MHELKKHGKVLTSKSVVTGPSSYEKRFYRAAVSQMLRNTGVNELVSVNVSEFWCPLFQRKNGLQCQQDRKKLRTELFWAITQGVVVICCRRFGTTYRSHLQGSRNQKMGPDKFPETSARNYPYSLRNNPKERSSHLLCEGRLK